MNLICFWIKMCTYPCHDKFERQLLIVFALDPMIEQTYLNPRAPSNSAKELVPGKHKPCASGFNRWRRVRRCGGHTASSSSNWLRAQGPIVLGLVEGFKNKAKVFSKRSYGFRTHNGLKIALYHAVGDPQAPKGTQMSCWGIDFLPAKQG